ncbi:hypothetical protein TL16_g09656 [Triparma laevis f. inornata]|uniref:Uncharacterized protein n=1 Tax=Triparma laevis f. inornata TaxID=1714386 RepID=A0A9W7EJW8_9STRA|nr:hypothetical protein TL16_g09656 [Triparma laevis f. inornata]
MLTTIFLLDPSPSGASPHSSPTSLDYQKMLSHSISSRLSKTLSPIGANCSFTLLRTHGGEGKYGGKCLTLLQELKGGGAPERFMSSLANLKQSNSPCPPNSLNSSISLALSIQSAAISSSHRTTPPTLHPLSTSCGRRPLITPSPAYLFLNLSTILNNKLSIRPQSFSALYNSPLVQWNRLQIVILAMEGVGEKEEKIVKGYRELCGAVGGRVWIWKGGNNRKINKLAEALTSSYTIPDLLPSSLLNHILTTPTLPYEIAPDAKKKSALPNITLGLGFNGQRFICDCTFLVQPVVQLREGEEPTDFPLLRPPTSSTPTIPFPDSPPNKPKSTYPNLTLLPTQPNAHCLTCLKPISSILEKFKMMKKGDRRIYYEMYFIQELRIPEGIYDAFEIIDRESKIEFGIVYKIAGNPGGVLIVCAPFIKMLGELTVKSLGISQAFFEKMKGKNTTIRPTPTGKLREEFKSFAGLVPPCYSDSIRNWCKVMDSAFAEDLTRHLPKVTYENANGRAEGEKARVFLDEGRKGGEGVEVDYRGVYEEARKKFFPSASNLSRRVTDNAQVRLTMSRLVFNPFTPRMFPHADSLATLARASLVQFSTVLEGEFNGRSKKISEQGNHRNRNVNESDLLRLCTVGRDGVWEGSFDDDVFPR